MKEVRWVVQGNLTNQDDIAAIMAACTKSNIELELIKVVPFSKEIPKFTIDEKINLYYGSTSFITNFYEVENPIGVFFGEGFTMDNYMANWKDYMLNSEAKITTFKEFTQENHEPDSLWFIRPDADDKSFAGEMMTFGKIQNWLNGIQLYDNVVLDENTKIVVGPPYNIKKEWRNFIVNGEVITSSRYRVDFNLSKSALDIPEEMLTFVKERCKEYTPHDIFVMDVALCGDAYYIIECNCINSTGFYHADIEKIFTEIPKAILAKYGRV